MSSTRQPKISTRPVSAARVSRTVRAAVGMSGHPCPIVDVDGFDPPRVEGEEAYTTFKNGGICRYPEAARRAGYRTVYHRSTLRILVGRGWLIENGLA